jgi:hypothetical protein
MSSVRTQTMAKANPFCSYLPTPRNQAVGRSLLTDCSSLNAVYETNLLDPKNIFFSCILAINSLYYGLATVRQRLDVNLTTKTKRKEMFD